VIFGKEKLRKQALMREHMRECASVAWIDVCVYELVGIPSSLSLRLTQVTIKGGTKFGGNDHLFLPPIMIAAF